MEAQLIARTASRSCPSSPAARLASSRAGPLQVLARRHKSTTNRTKRALNIPPHPSFLAGDAAAAQDRIVFNPPSSAASVYHTPFKFLPKSDPRRRANLGALFGSSTTLTFSTATSSPSSSSSSTTSTTTELPPKVNHEKMSYDKYHLTQDDVAEMRRLRSTDPDQWSVLALARKFDCSPIFVMQVVRLSHEQWEAHRERLDKTKSRWGHIRTQAREDRRKRKEMLYRGEI